MAISTYNDATLIFGASLEASRINIGSPIGLAILCVRYIGRIRARWYTMGLFIHVVLIMCEVPAS